MFGFLKRKRLFGKQYKDDSAQRLEEWKRSDPIGAIDEIRKYHEMGYQLVGIEGNGARVVELISKVDPYDYPEPNYDFDYSDLIDQSRRTASDILTMIERFTSMLESNPEVIKDLITARRILEGVADKAEELNDANYD